MSEIHYAQFENIAEASTRVTEGSDTRITEQDDVRITSDSTNNAAESTMVAQATRIPFVTTQYVKRSGEWIRISHIYVKYDGNWVEPTTIYKNVNGVWKRVK